MIAVTIEYHTSGEPAAGGVVQTRFASVYISTGVKANEVYGISDFGRSGASWVCVVERIPLAQAEQLVAQMIQLLGQCGVQAEPGAFYDE